MPEPVTIKAYPYGNQHECRIVAKIVAKYPKHHQYRRDKEFRVWATNVAHAEIEAEIKKATIAFRKATNRTLEQILQTI